MNQLVIWLALIAAAVAVEPKAILFRADADGGSQAIYQLTSATSKVDVLMDASNAGDVSIPDFTADPSEDHLYWIAKDSSANHRIKRTKLSNQANIEPTISFTDDEDVTVLVYNAAEKQITIGYTREDFSPDSRMVSYDAPDVSVPTTDRSIGDEPYTAIAFESNATETSPRLFFARNAPSDSPQNPIHATPLSDKDGTPEVWVGLTSDEVKTALAIDQANNHLYFGTIDGKLWRVSLDSPAQSDLQLFATLDFEGEVNGVCLDLQNNFIYWTTATKLWRGTLSSSGTGATGATEILSGYSGLGSCEVLDADEVEPNTSTIPWDKIALYGGIGLGVILVILLLVRLGGGSVSIGGGGGFANGETVGAFPLQTPTGQGTYGTLSPETTGVLGIEDRATQEKKESAVEAVLSNNDVPGAPPPGSMSKSPPPPSYQSSTSQSSEWSDGSKRSSGSGGMGSRATQATNATRGSGGRKVGRRPGGGGGGGSGGSGRKKSGANGGGGSGRKKSGANGGSGGSLRKKSGANGGGGGGGSPRGSPKRRGPSRPGGGGGSPRGQEFDSL